MLIAFDIYEVFEPPVVKEARVIDVPVFMKLFVQIKQLKIHSML